MSAVHKPLLRVVGCGPGGPGMLTGEARLALQEAGRLFAAPSLVERIAPLNNQVQGLPLAQIVQQLAQDTGRPATVSVSGDVGFYSFAGQLQEKLSSFYEIELLPGISSLQALCARLGIPWQQVPVLSLHGRPGNLLQLPGLLAYNQWVFLLAGSGDAAAALALMEQLGIPGLTVTAAEDLCLPEERITCAPPAELATRTLSSLTVLLAENPTPTDPLAPLPDSAFARARVPMTKEAVRALALSRLAPRPTDVVWDIGAGTGAISVALAYRACRGSVYAVEREQEALTLILENRRKLGAYNILPQAGEAPAALEKLPAPDAVFVGGSGGRLFACLQAALMKNPACRILVTAVTLETLHAARNALEALELDDISVTQLQVTETRQVSAYHMLRAQNPVWLLSGRGTA